MLDFVANANDSSAVVGDGGFVGRASGFAIPDCRTCTGLAHRFLLGCAGSFAYRTYWQGCN
jgi:hypothetical protein